MSKFSKVVKGEPVAIVGSLVSAYHAVVAYLLIAGIVHASATEVATLEGAVVAVLAIPVTLLVRSAVSPTSTP
jgi:hypothetical protein